MDGQQLKNSVKHFVAKVVTVGATVFISNAGVDALLNWVAGPSPESAAVLKAVSLVAAYAVWTQAVVPFVDGLIRDPSTASKTAAPAKSYFELV